MNMGHLEWNEIWMAEGEREREKERAANRWVLQDHSCALLASLDGLQQHTYKMKRSAQAFHPHDVAGSVGAIGVLCLQNARAGEQSYEG